MRAERTAMVAMTLRTAPTRIAARIPKTRVLIVAESVRPTRGGFEPLRSAAPARYSRCAARNSRIRPLAVTWLASFAMP